MSEEALSESALGAAARPQAAGGAPATTRRPRWDGAWLPWSGLVIALVLWQAGISLMSLSRPIAEQFGPWPALRALWQLLGDSYFWLHIGVSLKRIGVALACALLIGVPLGILSGTSARFARASGPLFQLLRMISPLSWMPLAVMALGVGDAPVYFLLTFAAVWPIVINTAAGVAQLNPNWLLLARSLAATRKELVLQVVLPGILGHVLTGSRLAIGVIWIVLVPAEMLGVSAGLGYFILDTRDRLAYPELMAAILVIGVLGYGLDLLARAAHAAWVPGPNGR